MLSIPVEKDVKWVVSCWKAEVIHLAQFSQLSYSDNIHISKSKFTLLYEILLILKLEHIPTRSVGL